MVGAATERAAESTTAVIATSLRMAGYSGKWMSTYFTFVRGSAIMGATVSRQRS
jgi:hypothetical protein